MIGPIILYEDKRWCLSYMIMFFVIHDIYDTAFSVIYHHEAINSKIFFSDFVAEHMYTLTPSLQKKG